MRVTLKDIAEDTGYSISTVSRVLNGSDKISTRARHQIYHSAKRLNYPLYRTLNGNSIVDTLKIFLIVTGFHLGEFYASLFYGLSCAAEKQNIRLSLVSIKKPFDEVLETIESLSNQKYDGSVIFAPEFQKSDYERIRETLPENFPVVSNGLIENPVFSTVSFDVYSGGFLAGEHFKKQGYSTCGIIRGPFRKAEARYRSNGFRDYIFQTKGIELIWDYQGDFTFKSGIKAFKAFQKLDEKPRAIFASNDAMCHAFMEEALMHGYTFPEDIAIVGFDDLPICNRHRPAISSIHTDYEELGTVTMEKIKELISNPRQQEKGVLSMVPVSLTHRESS